MRIGQIVGAFGIRGQVKVEALTDFLVRFKKGSKLRLDDKWVTVESYSLHKGRPLLKLSGIDTMSAAEALQWKYLESDEERPELEEGEFLITDLIGMKVVTVEGRELGEVDDILTNPAHDTLVVGEVLIPAITEFVTMMDFDTETITVRLIPGMLPEDEADDDPTA